MSGSRVLHKLHASSEETHEKEGVSTKYREEKGTESGRKDRKGVHEKMGNAPLCLIGE
jgi:hypothetical protein